MAFCIKPNNVTRGKKKPEKNFKTTLVSENYVLLWAKDGGKNHA